MTLSASICTDVPYGMTIPLHAILLDTESAASKKAAAFLDLLGIESKQIAPELLVGQTKSEDLGCGTDPACLVISGEDVALLAQIASRQGASLPRVIAPFSAIVLHSFGARSVERQAMEVLLGTKLSFAEFFSNSKNYSIRGDQSECGPLAGLSFGPIDKRTDRGLTVLSHEGTTEKLIEIDGAGLLTRIRRPSQDILISTATEIADLGQTMKQKIDFRTSFSQVIPLLLALRAVFRERCWLPRGYWANIIIDDPPLWARYGHLKLSQLAELTDRLPCACTIGMIPWNYRRSNRRIVSLLASREPRLGICFHGCNHTRAEFGIRDYPKLANLAATAIRRMDLHQQTAQLSCQPVMVFPQGLFSVEAMRCLRAAGYLAAVNTDTQDCQSQVSVPRADLMQPALLCYDNFPLFVRRNPEDGIVNFAVDAFLGKPCLVVVHHEFFKGGFGAFEELVQSISKLHPQLTWTNLETIVKESSLSRVDSKAQSIMKIFANDATVRSENSVSPTTVVRSVRGNGAVERVEVNGEPSEYTLDNGDVSIALSSQGEKSTRISILSARTPITTVTREPFAERMGVAARRYASEFRDNYLAQSDIVLNGAQSLRRILKKTQKSPSRSDAQRAG